MIMMMFLIPPPVARSLSGDSNNDFRDSSSEGEVHTSSEESDQPQKKLKCQFLPAYDMFDPIASKKADQTHLSANQSFYINKHFGRFIVRGTIKSQILEESPVPAHEMLVVPKADEAFVNLVPSRVKPTDKALAYIQARSLDTMGPLSALWKIFHKFKKRGAGELDLDVLLDLPQKSVLLVGQTQVAVNYHRRLNFMAAFTQALQSLAFTQARFTLYPSTKQKIC